MPKPAMAYSDEYVREHIKARIVVEDRGHSSPCWIWQSGVNGCGYATGRPAGCAHGLMHRIAYRAFVGSIPLKMVIDHLCRVRCCVNPAHLEPVTHGENLLRSWAGQSFRRKPTARETQRGDGPSNGTGRRGQTGNVRTHCRERL